MSNLSAEVARQLLRCEPETGRLFWKQRSREFFTTKRSWKTWNSRFSEMEAFTYCDVHGYRSGKILGRMYRAHRIVFLIQTGKWPPEQLDHVNGIRTDNRFSNLSAVSNAENGRNRKRQRNNTSGVTGVTWNRKEQVWYAQIKILGDQKYLGHFDTIEAAAAARKLANANYGFSERHGA